MSSTTIDATASSAAAISSASSVLNAAASASASAASVIAQVNGQTEQPPVFKLVGVLLAVASGPCTHFVQLTVAGLFIGSSFVVRPGILKTPSRAQFKKKGLLASQAKARTTAGEGHAYLKSPMWWTGMIIMIIGEICNFVAYAFAPALLVTPLGALSVVIWCVAASCVLSRTSAILSHIFLKERLTFFGKLGCLLCILGSTIVALNGPEEGSVSTIAAFEKLFLAPGFLVFGGVVILTSLGLIFFVAPKYGKKNMLVYIGVCSLIGGLSVSCTQGLGSSILTSIRGDNQFKNWFIYFLLGFVIITLLTEINYLNKALELFNTSMVTPTYYVTFTGATLITSVILYQGLHASAIEIVTVVFGFIVTCVGITILQMSKVDPTDLKLDRRTTILLSAANENTDNEKGLDAEDPGIDALRGGFGAIGSIYRARSARHSIASMARRRSQMSHRGQDEFGGTELKRHTLYDAPMPADAAERISLHSSQLSPGARPRAPTIGFSGDVIEHRYGTGRAPAGTAQHIEHHHVDNVDGPSRLRFGGGPIPGLPTSPRDNRGAGDVGTATILSPVHTEYLDPYHNHTVGPTDARSMAALASLSGKLQHFGDDGPSLRLEDPRARHDSLPHNAVSRRSSGHGHGFVQELFSPRRRAEADAEDEEIEGLVRGRHASGEDDELPRIDSRDTFESIDSIEERVRMR